MDIKKIITAILLFSKLFCVAQNVNILDPIFKDYFVNNSSINLNMDNEIQITEANIYSGDITLPNFYGVSDLSGIKSLPH